MNTPNFKSWSEPRDFASNKWQAKQIKPLAQQLDYLARAPKCTPKEGTLENSPHAKEHLQTTLSFLLHGQMNIWCLLLWLHNNPGSKKQRLFPGLLLLDDALPTPDAGGWAGTFGCTFGMAMLASIILWFVHAENVQNPLKNEKEENNTKGNLLHQRNKYTETYTAWCCRKRQERATSTLRLVLVCAIISGRDIMSLWKHLSPLITDRLKELNWTLSPSQCWLCRRLSGHALRQNLSRGLFSIWSMLHANTGLMKKYIAFGKPDTSIHYLHWIYIYLQQSGYAIINQNRVDMSGHEWTLPTSSLDLSLETLPPTNDKQSKSGLLRSS